MSHLDQRTRCHPHPFGLHRFLVGPSVFLLMSALAAGPVIAAEDAGLAFVLGPASHLTVGSDEVPLPAGARIELVVDGRKVGGRFPVKVSPGGLTMPAFDLGREGQQLRVRIPETAVGWLTPGADGLALELAATVEVEFGDDAQTRTGAYALVLTTGVPAAPLSGATNESGEVVDRTSRAARLVASGTVSADSPVAPGESFVVVLAGAFEGLPADLR